MQRVRCRCNNLVVIFWLLGQGHLLRLKLFNSHVRVTKFTKVSTVRKSTDSQTKHLVVFYSCYRLFAIIFEIH